MDALTLSELAEAVKPLCGDPEVAVEITPASVLLTRGVAEECELTLRDGMICLCAPLFAFGDDAAARVAEWALDLNLRNPEPGRIALHETAPVLLLLDSVEPEAHTLHGLAERVRVLWQTAETLRGGVPPEEAVMPVGLQDLVDGAVIFRP